MLSGYPSVKKEPHVDNWRKNARDFQKIRDCGVGRGRSNKDDPSKGEIKPSDEERDHQIFEE